MRDRKRKERRKGDKDGDFWVMSGKVKCEVSPEEWMEGLGGGRGLLAECGDNPAPV